MARDVFRLVWMDRKEAVLLTYQMLEDCAAKDSETYTTALSSKEAQLEKLQKSLERLRRMCAMEQQSAAFSLDFALIRETLDRWIDFPGPTISDALIEQFILQVVQYAAQSHHGPS